MPRFHQSQLYRIGIIMNAVANSTEGANAFGTGIGGRFNALLLSQNRNVPTVNELNADTYRNNVGEAKKNSR